MKPLRCGCCQQQPLAMHVRTGEQRPKNKSAEAAGAGPILLLCAGKPAWVGGTGVGIRALKRGVYVLRGVGGTGDANEAGASHRRSAAFNCVVAAVARAHAERGTCYVMIGPW